MRLSLFASLLSAVSIVAAASDAPSATNATAPQAPTWEFMYSCNVTMGMSIPIGTGIRNTNRTVFPISGGQFVGPKLNGKVLTIGAEFTSYALDSFYISDARYMLQTLDGAYIYVQTMGQSQAVDGVQLHLRYETANDKYAWMSDIMAIGILRTTSWGYTVNVWRVISPPYTP